MIGRQRDAVMPTHVYRREQQPRDRRQRDKGKIAIAVVDDSSRSPGAAPVAVDDGENVQRVGVG